MDFDRENKKGGTACLQTERKYISVPEKAVTVIAVSGRELYVANGGPDGGDGGRGGDLIFEVDKGLNTLVDFRHKRKFAAGDGKEGGKRRCHGKDGEDLILKVPEGTVIKEVKKRKSHCGYVR